MGIQNIIQGRNEEEVLTQIALDFETMRDLLQYDALIDQGGRQISLVIDIDPGGGFESGFETTTLTSPLQTDPGVRFAIHHEGILDEIGKFFGMQDVITGYSEFDKKVMVKSNDTERVKTLFRSGDVRNVFAALHAFSFGITTHRSDNERKMPFLEFNIERGIIDFYELKAIYSAFSKVLAELDQ